MVRVAYIIGAGRSGSTVLDILLGNHPQIESLGEFANFPLHGWLNGEYCSCGKPGNQCSFWTSVYAEWSKITSGAQIENYITLQSRYEHYNAWGRLVRAGNLDHQHFKQYTHLTSAFFKSVHNVSGRPIIVDSSKQPMRAYTLSKIESIDLRLIHMVRDVRGVAWSLKKPYAINLKAGIQKEIRSRPAFRTGLFWTFVNLQSEWVCSRIKSENVLHLRYENLVTDPAGSLEKVGRLLQLDLSSIIEKIKQDIPLETHHQIAGNRLRMRGELRLKADQRWKDEMPDHDRYAAMLPSAWLMKRYDY